MKSKTTTALRLKMRLAMRWTGMLLVGVIFVWFMFSASAMVQAFEAVWKDNVKLNKALAVSPQDARPDILWMRGGHHLQIYRVIYTSDNQKLITLNPNTPVGDVKIWRLSDGMLLRTIAFDAVNAKIDLAPDNQTLAILDFNQTANGWYIRLYDINTGNLLRNVNNLTSLNHLYGEPNVDFSPDGNTLLAGKDFIRVSDGVILRSLPSGGNQYPIIGNGKAFSPSGNTILTSAYSYDNYHTVELDSVTFQLVRNFNEACFSGIKPNFGAFSPNGSYVYGSDGSSVYIKNLSNGNCTGLSGGNFGGYRVASSPNSQFLAVSTITSFTSPATIRVFDMTTPTVPSLSYQFQSDAQGGVPPAIDFSPDNSLIASGGSLVKLWNVSDGSFNRQISQFAGGVNSVAFSADGQTVATASQKSTTSNQSITQNPGIKLWNTTDGSLRNINFVESNDISFYQLAFVSNGQQLIALDNSVPNYSVSFWDASTGALIRRQPANISCSGAQLLVSPNGQYYAVNDDCDGVTSFYNVSDDSLFRQYNYIFPLAFTPDGQSLIMMTTSNGSALSLVNVADGTEIRRFQNSSNIGGANVGAVSPDGSTLIVGTRESGGNQIGGTLHFWSIADGGLLRSINLNQGSINSIAFAPDGQTFSTLNQDKTVRVWQTSDGALLQTYSEETGTFPVDVPGQIAYSPDGGKFAFGRGDATIVMARNPYPTTSPATFTISGQITRNGSNLSGVSVALSGNSSETKTTDAAGNYTFTVLEGGSYTVTPQLANNTFAPPSQTFNFISANQTADFAASYITHTISGNVKADGANLQGATVVLNGSQSQTTTTDASGNYSLTANAGKDYTVSVYKNGLTFNPASQSFTNLQANQTADFQTGAPLCAPQPRSLVSWYKAENNGIDSANGLDGSVSNIGFGAGKSGLAFYTAGSQYFNVPDHSNLRTTRLSVAGWFRMTNVPAGGQFYTLASKYGGDYRGWVLRYTSAQTVSFEVYRPSTGAGVSSAAIPLNTWVHIVASYDGTNLKMYVNGVLSNTSTFPGSIAVSTVPMQIGKASWYNGEYSHAHIDEFQYFNSALSAVEVQSIYNAGSAGFCFKCVNTPQSMIAWYRAEDNGIDSTGNGYDGSIANSYFNLGKIGKAFDSEDNLYFTVPDNSNLRTASMTIAGWFQMRGIPASNQFYTLASKHDGGNNGWVLRYASDGTARFDVHRPSSYAAAVSVTTIPLGAWTHIAGSYDGTNLKIYVNGNLVGTSTLAGGMGLSATLPMHLGKASWNNSEHASARIDEFQYFYEALSAAEIASIYNNGNGLACQGGPFFTPSGANVTISPASSVNVNFANVTQNGFTVASVLTQSQLPPLPAGYSLTSPGHAYDVRTSAIYSSTVTVTFNVPNVASQSICSRMRSLHFESNGWTTDTNAAPVYNSATQICTVAQTVTSLSPFVVALGPAPTYTISGQITSGGNSLSGVTVNLSGSATNSTLTDSNGNYSFTVNEGGSYTVTPSLTNFTFSPTSATFNNLSVNQTANFSATNTCSYSINPTSANIGFNSGTGSVAVTAPAGCAWTAATTSGWLSVTSGAGGSGSGTVGYSYDANTGAARTGSITIAGQSFTVNQAAVSLEADVASRPNGNGSVNTGDVTQVQRFAVGMDRPFQSNEFQRADVAPRLAQDGVTLQLGNGSINTGDVTQAQRYAVGLDRINGAVPAAGGPAAPGGAKPFILEDAQQTENSEEPYDRLYDSDIPGEDADNAQAVQATYEVRAVRESLTATTLTVAIRLDTDASAATPAASVGGTLRFDQLKLSNPTNVRLGSGPPAGTSFFANTSDTANGRLGFTINAPVNQTFGTGERQLLLIDFTVIGTGSTDLSFDDSQAQRFVGDVNGNELTNSEFPTTSISLSPTSAAVTVSGRVVFTEAKGNSIFGSRSRVFARAKVSFIDAQGEKRSRQTNRFGFFQFEAVETGYTYIFEAEGKNNRFAPQVVTVNETIDNLNFTSSP